MGHYTKKPVTIEAFRWTGERYAYDDAFRQIWAFEAYLLREQLSAASNQAA